jgi:hypothetical protein
MNNTVILCDVSVVMLTYKREVVLIQALMMMMMMMMMTIDD